jgi:hypothetical protein
MDNNVVDIAVTIGDPNLVMPTEACDPTVDRHSSDGVNRECGWELAQTFACVPGTKFDVGCAATCFGIGSCTGDPILRVCDAASPDGNCSYPSSLGSDDDSCGSQCPLVFNETCPDSGQVAVYHAPFTIGGTYRCNVEMRVK